MTKTPVFLLDSDVFIAAKNAYYAFDICPGFWTALIRAHQAGKVPQKDTFVMLRELAVRFDLVGEGA